MIAKDNDDEVRIKIKIVTPKFVGFDLSESSSAKGRFLVLLVFLSKSLSRKSLITHPSDLVKKLPIIVIHSTVQRWALLSPLFWISKKYWLQIINNIGRKFRGDRNASRGSFEKFDWWGHARE